MIAPRVNEMRDLNRTAYAALLWISFACSSPAPLAPLTGGSGGTSGNAGSTFRAGAGGSTDVGEPPDASSGGASAEDSGAAGLVDPPSLADAGTGGVAGDAEGPQFSCSPGEPPKVMTRCALAPVFGDALPISVDSGAGARLIAVTPDELTVVWSSDGAAGPRFFFADRSAVDEGYGPATQVLTDDSVVGLSPDGLRLVTLSPSGTDYGELSREVRGYDFALPSATEFARINSAASAGGVVYRDCVISADDRTLLYTALTANSEEFPIRIATRSGSEPWPVGTPISRCELQRHGNLIRHPTGLSSDGLTLFFFDPDRKHARAGFRPNADADFSYFVELEGVGRSGVNESCTALYYSGPNANEGLVVSALNAP